MKQQHAGLVRRRSISLILPAGSRTSYEFASQAISLLCLITSSPSITSLSPHISYRCPPVSPPSLLPISPLPWGPRPPHSHIEDLPAPPLRLFPLPEQASKHAWRGAIRSFFTKARARYMRGSVEVTCSHGGRITPCPAMKARQPTLMIMQTPAQRGFAPFAARPFPPPLGQQQQQRHGQQAKEDDGLVVILAPWPNYSGSACTILLLLVLLHRCTRHCQAGRGRNRP